MAYVYRYLEANSDYCVYIGKAAGNSFDSLESRLRAHNASDKFKRFGPKYRIEYIEGLTPAEADILETAFIAENEVIPKLNNAKTDWGRCGIIDLSKFVWKSYPPDVLDKEKAPTKFDGLAKYTAHSFYCCHCCGTQQKTHVVKGRRRVPAGVSVQINFPENTWLAGIWLCDNCIEDIGAELYFYVNSLSGSKCFDNQTKQKMVLRRRTDLGSAYSGDGPRAILHSCKGGDKT